MPVIGIGNILHVQVLTLLQSQLGVNTYDFVASDVTNQIEVQDAADDISTYYGLLYKPLLSTHASYRGVRVQLRTETSLFQPVYSILEQGQGDVLGDPLPKQCAGVITRRTAKSGRKFQGRIYVPFPGEADNDPNSGRPSGNYITRLTALAPGTYDSLNVASGTGSAVLQQVHFLPGLVPTLLTSEPYVSATPRAYWATQRRRGDYGPQNVSPI